MRVIAAIILAAGDSTRMGSPKALLRDRDGSTFIARIVRALADASLNDITVATGTRHAEIVGVLAADRPPVPIRFANNSDPSRGQLSSLWTAMDAAVRPGVRAILVMLVDAPFVSPVTIRQLMAAYVNSGYFIVRPVVEAQYGHPVIFDRAVFAELRAAPLEQGAKAVLRRYESHTLNVAVDDPQILLDIDTPTDYQRAVG
jgi:molybdenum cofactor cytidylyltransferase